MDKLEPLIRHRFWILFVITLPLALAGYYSANAEMQAATEAKEVSLEGVLNRVPQGDTEPNQTYAQGLKIINDQQQRENDIEIQKLWEAQRERMHWPEIMLRYLPKENRGPVEKEGRRQYVKEYPGIVKRLWERVQPVVDDPPPRGLTVDWPQKVVLMPETIPLHTLESVGTISDRKLWDAQEDIWLMELLFDAVVRTNQDAAYVGDASVRRIDRLFLIGGSGESSVKAKKAAAPASNRSSGSNVAAIKMAPGMTLGGGDRTRRGGPGKPRRRASSGSVSFNIAEEIGPEVPDPEFEDDNSSLDAEALARAAFSSSSAEGASVNRNMFRYVGMPEDVEKAPYRERAFYMSVIIMLPDLPDFFTELASSEWPIRVGRFHIGSNPYRTDGTGSVIAAPRNARGSGRPGNGFRFSGNGGGKSAFSRSGGGKFPPTMVGPSEIDPYWFASPDLVQVDFYGVITMYNPVTNDEIVPTSDGTTEEESLKEIAEQEAAAEQSPDVDLSTPEGNIQTASSEEPSSGDGEQTDVATPDPVGENEDSTEPTDESSAEEPSSTEPVPVESPPDEN